MKAPQKLFAFAIAAAFAASCTMKNQDAPPLTGPAEFGTSVNISVSPDVLEQNGASQSLVSVIVRGTAGQPLANQQLRAEIRVNGLVADFGSLSSKSVVSGSDGRATFVYTAPPSVSTAESLVDIAVTPIGGSYGDNVTRTAKIRLVPPGVITPPSGMVPAFTFSPSNPTEGQATLFSARTSTSPANNPIAQYSWDFGNGRSATGIDATETFSGPGVYFVRLTVMDNAGRTASTSQSVTVGQAAAPVAQFTFSPTDPLTNTNVHFNAAGSTAAPGRRIIGYRWDYGDGSGADGVQVAHGYTRAQTYTVTLTVTDDIGRTNTRSATVQVK